MEFPHDLTLAEKSVRSDKIVVTTMVQHVSNTQFVSGAVITDFVERIQNLHKEYFFSALEKAIDRMLTQ